VAVALVALAVLADVGALEAVPVAVASEVVPVVAAAALVARADSKQIVTENQ
jgi:hypothetical protein